MLGRGRWFFLQISGRRRIGKTRRLTDTISLGHLDIASLLELLQAHADTSPDRSPPRSAARWAATSRRW
ncbi:MAG: hypothetical protein ACK41W_01915, partial [Cyanobacteriota bacterium]